MTKTALAKKNLMLKGKITLEVSKKKISLYKKQTF